MSETQNPVPPMRCEEFERLVVFYACHELEPAVRAAAEHHAAGCATCAASLTREQQLVAAVAAHRAAEPSAVLLAQCRGELADRLDDFSPAPGFAQRVKAWLRPQSWFVVRPAWSAALFILLGLALGVLVPRWLLYRGPQTAGMVSASPVVVRPPSDFSGQDLRAVDRINIVPGAGAVEPGVQFVYRGAQPRVASGSLDDGDVRRALIFVMQDNQLFDSGLRLDSLEALRARSDDAEVRDAFCRAARSDKNPGVRLKALEALRGFEQEAQVRKTLMDALLRDDNPGVRIEAINALRAAAGAQPDAELVNVLRDRMRNDPNSYIRLQSAAAVRQIGSHTQY